MKDFENYECEGQMTIDDYLRDEPVYDVDVVGMLDDPVCPQCGYYFETVSYASEVDCERCPRCHIKIKWDHYHNMEDVSSYEQLQK